jgi:hypothetical protein
MWLTGLSGVELEPPCGMTFKKHAQSFLLYSSYIIIGLGFVGGWVGRAWRKAHTRKRGMENRASAESQGLTHNVGISSMDLQSQPERESGSGEDQS